MPGLKNMLLEVRRAILKVEIELLRRSGCLKERSLILISPFGCRMMRRARETQKRSAWHIWGRLDVSVPLALPHGSEPVGMYGNDWQL